MNNKNTKRLITICFLIITIIIALLYVYQNIPRLVLIPSSKIRLVQIALQKIRVQGMEISDYINKEYTDKDYPKELEQNKIQDWEYSIISNNSFKLSNNIFRYSKLVLIVERGKGIKYKWEYYPTPKSEVEYLYIAP